jgi:hypothetical protein
LKYESGIPLYVKLRNHPKLSDLKQLSLHYYHSFATMNWSNWWGFIAAPCDVRWGCSYLGTQLSWNIHNDSYGWHLLLAFVWCLARALKWLSLHGFSVHLGFLQGNMVWEAAFQEVEGKIVLINISSRTGSMLLTSHSIN